MAEIRKVESGKLLCVEGQGSRNDVNEAFETIEAFLKVRKVSCKGDRMALFYDEPTKINHDNAHFGAAVELAGETNGDGEVIVVIQTMMKVACEMHRGAYDTIGESYQKLVSWIHERGFKIVGPLREYYIKGPGLDGSGDSNSFQTEIQIPVERVKTRADD